VGQRGFLFSVLSLRRLKWYRVLEYLNSGGRASNAEQGRKKASVREASSFLGGLYKLNEGGHFIFGGLIE
jgi:hypothetical protein